MRGFYRRCILTLLLLGFSLPLSAGVLVLHSYSSTLSWTVSQQRGILEIIDDGPGGRDIYLEFMDTKRSYGEEYFRRYAALLEEKYSPGSVDYIIATDNHALAFLRQYRDELFGEVPLIFSGVNFYEPELAAGLSNVTGVAEVLDYQGLFGLIRRFHPNLERVVVVHDGTVTAERNIEELLGMRDELQVPLYVHGDHAFESILSLVGDLTPREPIFLISSIRDRNGAFMEFEAAASLLRHQTEAPLYGAWRFFLGHGIVGGPLIDGEAYGRRAGSMLLSLELGATPEAIRVFSRPITSNAFDFRELRRFNIRLGLLPENAEIINRPLPILQEYPTEVAAGATTVGILLLLLLLLFVNIRTRKVTEERLTAAVDEKTTLLREIHHRVKNNLQIVSSLMNIQQSRIDDADTALIFQEFENRVQSIALVHEQLYQGAGQSEVATEPYITDLLGRIGDSYLRLGETPEVVVQVDETRLSIDQTLLLGLLVNEAVSNCYKHAFNRDGAAAVKAAGNRIDVSLESRNGIVRLTVRDNGVGFILPEDLGQTETMGLQLIASLTDQLGGTVALNGNDGTTVDVRFAKQPSSRRHET